MGWKRPLRSQSLMNHWMVLEDAEGTADVGGLVMKFPGAAQAPHTTQAFAFVSVIFWVKNLWTRNLCFPGTVAAGYLGLINQLWLIRDQHH